jgi:hypothetical protein
MPSLLQRIARRTASTAAGVSSKGAKRRPRPTWLAAGMLGILGFLWYRDWSRQRAERSLGKEVEKWEGEGGNVPDVATVHPTALPPSTALH